MTVQLKKSWTVDDLLLVGKDLGMDISKTDRSIQFTEVVAAETAAPAGLAVASSQAQIQTALSSPKALIVVPLPALAHPALQPHILRLVGCQNPGLFWGRALENFHPHGRDLEPTLNRHPSAVINETAQIDPTAIIEAYSVIGPNVKVMAHAWIGPHCVIEAHAVIGESSRLQSHVFIGARTLIGRRVHIKPSTVIGSAGFGMSHDQNGHHHAIPQVGRVVIEDDVFIGALCNIDRATLSETWIGTGTKLDSLVHIAHNCVIGKHTILTGSVAIAGSTTVGDHCVFGGRCTISDHVNICDHVQLAGLSGVSKDITEPGAYGGFPLQKLKDFLRSSVSISQLPRLRKDVGTILRHLGLKESL